MLPDNPIAMELKWSLTRQHPNYRILNVRYRTDTPSAYALCVDEDNDPHCLKTEDGGNTWRPVLLTEF